MYRVRSLYPGENVGRTGQGIAETRTEWGGGEVNAIKKVRKTIESIATMEPTTIDMVRNCFYLARAAARKALDELDDIDAKNQPNPEESK